MKYSLIDFAKEVLNKEKRPMTCRQIWEKGESMGLVSKLGITGKTPKDSLSSMLHSPSKKEPELKKIEGTKPAKFYFRDKTGNAPNDKQCSYDTITETKTDYKEIDLHRLLSYYVYTNPSFGRGKKIYTKTIDDKKSVKQSKGIAKWTYPDMVGVYMPFEWQQPLVALGKTIAGKELMLIYSFEIKKVLDSTTYRESFFQTVSNSSWANEGYLVAAKIEESDDLIQDLQRLSMSFGIGVIEMDMEEFGNTKVLFPASKKNSLDWEMMNKLAMLNNDFSEFLIQIKKDFEVNDINDTRYAERIDDPEKYIKKIMRKK